MRRRHDPGARRLLAIAGAIVVALGLATWNLELQRGLDEDRRALRQLEVRLAQEPTIFALVDSPTSQKLTLHAPGLELPGAESPYGRVYSSPSATGVVAMVDRLAPSDPNEEYRLYLTDRFGTTANLGVIRLDADGFGLLVADTSTRGGAYLAARVYLQPRGSDGLDGTLVLLFAAL